MISKNYTSLDLTKYIASIFIVWIHCTPLFNQSRLVNFLTVNGICRIAVPFFFITSSYLFFDKTNPRIREYIQRILTIYCSWTLIYLLLNPLFKKSLSINSFSEFLISFFINSFEQHLWYLPALVLAMVICNYLQKYISIKLITVIGFFLYLIGLLSDSYYFLIKNTSFNYFYTPYLSLFSTCRNGLFFGLFWVSIGGLMAQNKSLFSIKNNILFSILLTGSIGILILETYLIFVYGKPKSINFSLGIILPSIILVRHAFDKKCTFPLNYKLLRDFSILIYLFHFIPLYFYKYMIQPLFISEYHFEYRFIFCLIISHIGAFLIRKLPNSIKSYLY